MQLEFYNTINESGDKLTGHRQRVQTQGQRIYAIFKLSGFAMTPFEVQDRYNARYAPAPITSIRRAITNLTETGKLKKLDEQKKGKYGVKNYKWIAI